MPGQRTPAAPLGGAASRRHAELLRFAAQGAGAGGGSPGRAVSVKDLRLRRVVPPASASLVTASPECAAAADTEKPGSLESTPPEAVAAAAAAAEDLERKPALPRSKLVRDPGSFGYRRLLPFLNQMVKDDGANGKGATPSENTVANPKRELDRSYLRSVDESLGESPRVSDPMDSLEPTVAAADARGDAEMKDGCSNVREETDAAPRDTASTKPWLTRCVMSRIVHHASSFSYKRMLPFLMENEISSQEGDRVKIRRIAEGRQPAPNENDDLAGGEHHLAMTEDSSKECSTAQIESVVEEKLPEANGNDVLGGRQLQHTDPRSSPPECSTAELQNVVQEEEALTSNQDPPTYEGALASDGNDVVTGVQPQLDVSGDSSEECNRDGIKTRVQDKALKSDGSYVLDVRKSEPAVSEASPLEDSSAEVQVVTPEQALNSDEDKEIQEVTREQPSSSDEDKKIFLTSEKVKLIPKEQPQPCVPSQLGDNTEFNEAPQCQNSGSGCCDVGIGSPTKTVIPLLHQHCAPECQDAVVSLDDPLVDIAMIHRPADPCAVDRFLSEEEMSGCSPLTASGSSKASVPQPRSVQEKRGCSPKKLSPKKGILKRHTRGCKGICMCLDCSTFRLRADRAFEFSRKQMHEADDIIGNLLKEVANLRSLVEKPTGQQEAIQAACRRAARVEEVARGRCQQMFVDLNSHCRIPGPRVSFTQYVDEKMGSSPRPEKMGSSPRPEKMGSSPRRRTRR
ncbi:hypothetical protein ACP4OV_020811 [Aristida adscensionis]